MSYLCLCEEDPPLAPLAEGELDAVLLGGVHGTPAHPHPRQAAHVGGHAPHAAPRAPHQARNWGKDFYVTMKTFCAVLAFCKIYRKISASL